MTHHNIASADFSKKTLRALASRDLYVVGSTYAPSADGTWANAERVYTINDHGTARVRTFREVIALAD